MSNDLIIQVSKEDEFRLATEWERKRIELKLSDDYRLPEAKYSKNFTGEVIASFLPAVLEHTGRLIKDLAPIIGALINAGVTIYGKKLHGADGDEMEKAINNKPATKASKKLPGKRSARKNR